MSLASALVVAAACASSPRTAPSTPATSGSEGGEPLEVSVRPDTPAPQLAPVGASAQAAPASPEPPLPSVEELLASTGEDAPSGRLVDERVLRVQLDGVGPGEIVLLATFAHEGSLRDAEEHEDFGPALFRTLVHAFRRAPAGRWASLGGSEKRSYGGPVEDGEVGVRAVEVVPLRGGREALWLEHGMSYDVVLRDMDGWAWTGSLMAHDSAHGFHEVFRVDLESVYVGLDPHDRRQVEAERVEVEREGTVWRLRRTTGLGDEVRVGFAFEVVDAVELAEVDLRDPPEWPAWRRIVANPIPDPEPPSWPDD